MRGEALWIVGAVTVMVAVGALVYILWTTSDYSARCKTEKLDICNTINGPNFVLFIMTLVVAGLVLVSSTIVYILFTT